LAQIATDAGFPARNHRSHIAGGDGQICGHFAHISTPLRKEMEKMEIMKNAHIKRDKNPKNTKNSTSYQCFHMGIIIFKCKIMITWRLYIFL